MRVLWIVARRAMHEQPIWNGIMNSRTKLMMSTRLVIIC